MTTTLTAKARKQQEQEEAIARLRELFPIGSTVHTILRHVSSSGMSRDISVLVADESGSIRDVSHLVARAGIAKASPKGGAVRLGGVGMDMGFALVYSMARTLYRDGFPCTGAQYGYQSEETGTYIPRCPSNDHVNERGGHSDYGYTRMHSDPGYALEHRWV